MMKYYIPFSSSDDGDFHWAANTCKRKRSALKRDQTDHSVSPIMRLRAHHTNKLDLAIVYHNTLTKLLLLSFSCSCSSK